MLLNRYSNIDYVLNLEFEEGYELLDYAIKQKNEELLFFRWAVCSQNIDFEEFKKKLGRGEDNTKTNSPKNESVDEILGNVKTILNSINGGEDISGNI